jgi:predicted nucleic acid-binding protein
VLEEWHDDIERLLAQFDDQAFSYVDATSFVTMRRLGVPEAFSFDSDFLIAGFALVSDT